MYEDEDKLYIFARQSVPDVAEALLHVDKQLARGQAEMVNLVLQRRALLGRVQQLANERYEIEKTARVLCLNAGLAPDQPHPEAVVADPEDSRPAWVHYVEDAQRIMNQQKAPANEDAAITQLSRAVALAPPTQAGHQRKPVTLTRAARRVAAAKARRKQ